MAGDAQVEQRLGIVKGLAGLAEVAAAQGQVDEITYRASVCFTVLHR